ncbi:MAG: U32 family peptidase [Gammaproteobacteria bacterium]|nr:U32 family peptidase [Gammaproteobacteria bacterium]
MKISLASIPYFWQREEYFDFYEQLSDTNVDIVYLGETICSKRRALKLEDWMDISDKLFNSGKQVVLSTMTLLESVSELKYLNKIASQKTFLIEANDVAAIQLAKNHGHQFVAGCAINIYNKATFDILRKSGMTRWVVPVEMGKEDISPLISHAKKHQIEIEYQAFGRMPLAYSARCFSARHYQRPKDNCQFVCQKDPQGILVKSREGEHFAQINGIQTQSATVTNLLNYYKDLHDSGIDVLRIVPVDASDTLVVINSLSKVIGDSNNDQTSKDLLLSEQLNNDYSFCNGYWFQMPGIKMVS